VSLLSARSNQYSFERLPSDAGIEPVNLFEFIDLQAWNTMDSHFLFMYRANIMVEDCRLESNIMTIQSYQANPGLKI
jgi:hypothetical protein